MAPIPVSGLAFDNHNTTSDYARGSNWMSQMPDDKQLSELNMVGAHDAASTRTLGRLVGAKCQSISITEMCRRGLRVFDLRFAYKEPGTLVAHHGPLSQKSLASEIFAELKEFLASNPGETVLIIVKQEQTKIDGDAYGQSIEEALNSVSAATTDQTRLGDARGKIVLIMRDFILPLLPFIDFDVLPRQDNYDAETTDLKIESIQQGLDATMSGPQNPLYLNYLSMAKAQSGGWRIMSKTFWPSKNARVINQWFVDWMMKGSAEGGRVSTGAIMTDYAGVGLVSAVVESNF